MNIDPILPGTPHVPLPATPPSTMMNSIMSAANTAFRFLSISFTFLQHLVALGGFGFAGFLIAKGKEDGFKIALITFAALTALNVMRLLFFGFNNSFYSQAMDIALGVGGFSIGFVAGLVA